MSKKRIRFPGSSMRAECKSCGTPWADHPGILPTCESLARLRLAAVNCREAQLNAEKYPSTKATAARLCAEAHLDVLLEELHR